MLYGIIMSSGYGNWMKLTRPPVYNLQPGDFKAVDVDGDGKYVDLDDKQFIGHDVPQLSSWFKK